jgi:S-adenosylmethionine:tRNA ribosyltransferase-isomerase
MSWDYRYPLAPEFIAQNPVNPRDSSRLLVINRKTGDLSHHIFRDLPKILNPTDVLVFNDTRVFPARLFGKKQTGGNVEILLLKNMNNSLWEVISHPGLKPNQTLIFSPDLQADVISSNRIKLTTDNLQAITKIGNTPLPPYIHSSASEKTLRRQYQTVYAKPVGSAAAPTAGLHFTPRLLTSLPQQKEFITLHIGLGTFKTPTPEQMASGTLHSEFYTLDKSTAIRLNSAKTSGRRIVAVGTTTARVLETTGLVPGSGDTDLFIRPGYKFKVIDGLITNFHLPGSSLLMLVSAFASPEIIRHAYNQAVLHGLVRVYNLIVKGSYFQCFLSY